VATGSLEDDFTIMGTTKDDLVPRFARAMREVTDALSGRDPGLLAGDVAVKRCVAHPVPVISAAMSFAAVRRAAECGAGLLYAGVTANHHCRAMTDAYRAAGGTSAIILIRRVSVGQGGRERHAKQVGLYRTYTTAESQTRWREDQLLEGDPDTIAEELRQDMAETGADALNLRVHVPGISPEEAAANIAGLSAVVERMKTP
jgi:alkanesulfonate monooxygenase SsuD/methylene tetrahydromethanopterin reductase-like flavin-dependent oxidoreductase (luciferase family)